MNPIKYMFQNIPDAALNKVTLGFKDAALERLFFQYYTEQYLIHGRICHVLAVVFYSAFGIFDAVLFPDSKQTMWFIRYGIVLPVFVFGFLYSYSDSYKKYWQYLFMGYVLITGGGYVYMVASTPFSISYFLFTGIIFCLFFGYAFIRLRVIFSSIAGWVLTLGYIIVVTRGNDPPDAIIMNNLPHILGINFLGMCIGYFMELAARHNFLLINDLGRVESQLRNSHKLLEERVKDRTRKLEKANRELIRDKEKRHKIEDQLRQAQKMESVGRLAGGVAHDYNNALSVIMGFTELAMTRVEPDGKLHANLKEVLKASERAANITRQLLAFARKQTIAPKALDLNRNVEDMLKMLRRLIGEDIDLVWLPGEGRCKVKMDPSQIDQLLANLCVNARDAIKGVGRIIIETSMITLDDDYCASHNGFVPGRYVRLAVSDNGCGMDKELLEDIFEPFFTTKAVDKGTGLGLSTVYGILKQNKGFVNVYSEPGTGTTINCYLLQHEGSLVESENEALEDVPSGNGETILLVEDDLSILKLTQEILDGLGYSVLAAGTPDEAVKLSKEFDGKIHLLVTDVIMPEMNGRELSTRMKSDHPDLNCVFMSGYTADVIAYHGVLDRDVCFIQKPFSKTGLAKKVRKALDRA